MKRTFAGVITLTWMSIPKILSTVTFWFVKKKTSDPKISDPFQGQLQAS